jgi:hypothetical protein
MSRRIRGAGTLERVRLAVLLAIVAALAAAGVRAAPARADGDPASDVLVYQPVFYPYAAAPHALEHRLSGLVRSANQQGYRIRIAIIQSRRDLGAVPELFEKPAVYARFLGSELSSIWRGRVLVVMPNGYGIAQGAHLVRSASGVSRIVASTGGPDALVLRHLAPPAGTSPADLVAAAERAVRALAARHDVALVAAAAPAAGSGGRSRATTLLVAAVSVVVGLAAGTLWFMWRTRPGRA